MRISRNSRCFSAITLARHMIGISQWETYDAYGEIAAFENNKVTMGEQYDVYTTLLTEFLHTTGHKSF